MDQLSIILSRTVKKGHARREVGSQSQGAFGSAQLPRPAPQYLGAAGIGTAAHILVLKGHIAMLARIRKAQEENEGGFTLIELLVVMIIIGILAAIAIPVFLSQRAKAQDSAAKADVSTIGKEIATYYVDNTAAPTLALTAGRYVLTTPAVTGPPAVAAVANDIGKASANVALTLTLGTGSFVDATKWCVDVTNSKGSQQIYKYSAKGGLDKGVCASTDVS